MAITYLSALAKKAFSGGAVGSSQSPSWKPVSQSPVSETRSTQVRTCRAIEGWHSSSTLTSPYASHNAQGTQTPASLQIAVGVSDGQPVGLSSRFTTSGTTSGTTPPACCCSAARSSSQSRRKALTSNR